jgi:DNA-binding response OmpR family regulator
MENYILIVENEPDIADIVRRYLEFEGFTTACATSCEAAREVCTRHLPDLIVLDWRLPDLNGDQWVAELRANPMTSAIPIVMMTGGYPTSALTVAMAQAQIPILIKPFSLDLLLEYVEQMIPRQRSLGAD